MSKISVKTQQRTLPRSDHQLEVRNFVEYGGGEEEIQTETIDLRHRSDVKQIRMTTITRPKSLDDAIDAEWRTVRKQVFATIGLMISKFKEHSDIEPWVAEAIDEITFGIERLSRSVVARRFEGNAIEALRMLRDALCTDDRNLFAVTRVQETISREVNTLRQLDSVGPTELSRFEDAIDELGLESCAILNSLQEEA